MGGSYVLSFTTVLPSLYTVVLLYRILASYTHLTLSLGVLSLRNALLEEKTQNSEVLMLGLCTSENGYQAPTKGGGWEGGTPNATSCGFSTGPASII